MDPHDVDVDVDVEDKADWSSRTENRVPVVKPYRKKGLEHYQTLGEIFNTTTASDHLRFSSSQVPLSSDEDRELENNFLGHGVHVDIEDDDSMEPLSETRTEKRPRQPIAT
ncbi:hypothetical protein CUMW_167500 [Citrus unshiu]|nr:hypothetical protein CUMW_167490 [Citrus unshiu]GAY55877.1 hypothetical protein CUMW_167500 [Citrus unshiu]